MDFRHIVQFDILVDHCFFPIYICYAYLSRWTPEKLQEKARFLDSLDHYVIPQLGISFDPEHAIDPEFAPVIRDTVAALKAFNRPIFLRLGYEFNGHWNPYIKNPKAYVKFWKLFVEELRRQHVRNVAMVWCYVPDGSDRDYMKYYPGDAYVDWWAFDPFSAKDITSSETTQFIEDAARHRCPVMIGESTPRWIGARQGERSWRVWFQRYFELFDRFPHVKAFCYIAWDWSKHVGHEPSPYSWHWWGDARIWKDPYVFAQWKRELSKPRYIHGTDEKRVRAALTFAP